MGITKFLYLLLFFSIAIIFYDIDQVTNEKDEEQKPLVSFYDSVIYNVNTENVKTIIPSKEAYLYKTREELFNGMIITRSGDKSNISNTNRVSADSMIKIGDDIYLDGNINMETADGMILKTEQLQYNLKTKIIQNEEKFVARKGFHDFYGNNLYYDDLNRYLQAKYTHFNIKVENE